MKQKPILPVKAPASEIPMRKICGPFRFQFVVPGPGIEMFEDPNGNVQIQGAGGASILDLVAGDNIDIQRTEDGKIVISAVDTAVDIAAGQNITIDIDPETGTAIINSIIGGPVSEHYQGVFNTPEDLIAFDTDPEPGDYGMIKQLVFSDGGDITWNGQYKYCFYISGAWTVVDQMLTFTDNIDLLQQFYSVGGGSPVIYLHKVAQTGSFKDLRDVPIVATPVATVEGNTITANCATEGAEIWYSTDGSMPHVNGTKYTGPISVSGFLEETVLRFVAIKNGMINSEEATAYVGYTYMKPTIELDWHTGAVSMNNPNPYGEIRYTVDGSDPTDQSTLYSEPFVITEATVIKAFVTNSGNYSGIAEASYEKTKLALMLRSNGNTGQLGYSVQSGNYTDAEEVKYTIDGSDPDYSSDTLVSTVNGQRYGNPFVFKARGYREGYVPSSVVQRNGSYDTPSAPQIVFNSLDNAVTLNRTGNVIANPEVLLVTDTQQDPTHNCRIYYTLDGSTPTDQSTLYTGPFQISRNVTVKAVLVAYGQYSSAVATESIVITNAPTISLDSDTGYVSISGPDGAALRYTIDGSTPTEESTLYDGPFSVENRLTVTVKAIAIVDGQSSEVTTETYRGLRWTGSGGTDINYEIGTVSRSPMRAEDGATVYYGIVSGGYPSSWILYEGDASFSLFDSANPKEVFFRQTKPGYIPSNYGGVRYGYTKPDAPVITIDEVSETATIALGGNTVNIPLQTNENVPTVGARIYYTTDGSTPSAQNGTLYDGVSEIPFNGTFKAVTVCYGQYVSDVASYYKAPKISFDSMTGMMSIDTAYPGSTRYTTNGSTPSISSPLYVNPVEIIEKTTQSGIVTMKAGAIVNGTLVAVSELTLPILSVPGASLASIIRTDVGTCEARIATRTSDVLTTIKSIWIRKGGGLPDASQEIENWIQLAENHYQALFDNIELFGHPTQAEYWVKFYKEGYVPVFAESIPVGYNLPDAPSVSYDSSAITATFSRSGNTDNIPVKYDTTDPDKGLRIYYTTDGSTPSAQNGTLWDGNAVQLQAGDILKCMCVCYGQYASGVTVQNVYVPESALSDDDVAVVVKNTTSGNLRYVPYDKCVVDAIDSDDYTLKEFIRFTRGKNGRPVFMHKDQTSGMWAEFNRYRLSCDTTAPGGFDWSVVINGTPKGGTVTWQAGDTLDDILAQLNTQAVATYLVFAHVEGEQFIRITQGGYGNSTFTLSNNTGATLTDLSFYTKIGDVQQTETHRTWQAMNVNDMFPTLGFLASNTVQYAVNGYNLSYMCGGNETRYKAHYRTNGSSSYLAENAVSSRMSEAAFNALNGSGVAEQQELYDKYDGSWDAYMEASMVKIDDTNANGIEYQSYDNGDTQTAALASVTTMDFDGSYIHAFPCAAHCQNFTDNDVANGKFNMNTEHELAVFMRDAKMADINAAFDVLIAAGMTATKLSVSSYYYWSVARYDSYDAWFYYAYNGSLTGYGLYIGLTARPLAYPVNS